MLGPCDCCTTALNYPDLTRKTFSLGCVYCGARYLANGGKHISDWERYGVSVKSATEAQLQGELIDPELKKRKGKK